MLHKIAPSKEKETCYVHYVVLVMSLNHEQLQSAARTARQVIFAPRKKRTPVLRPEFTVEHDVLL